MTRGYELSCPVSQYFIFEVSKNLSVDLRRGEMQELLPVELRLEE
jgi:hypothetical protein